MISEISNDVWEKFLDGNRDSFSKIYYTYVQDMFNYAFCFSDDYKMIEDCIHEVFVKFYYQRDKVLRDSIKYYLIKSLRNEIFNQFRKKKTTYSIDELENEFFPVYSVEEMYIKEEQNMILKKSINEMLDHLTPNQREAIYYKYEQELSLEQIAQIMGINYQSAANLIQRSIKKLRQEFGNTMPLKKK